MKLCIPVGSPSGLESPLEPHLPRAEYLLFFDTESRACTEISLRDQSGVVDSDLQMHAVLCGSINRVTLRTLIEQGVKVYGTDALTAGQAIAQYENGELEAAVVAAGGCGSGAHGHGGGCGGGGCGGTGHNADHAHDDHGCHGAGGGCGGHGHDGAGASGGCCGTKSSSAVPATESSPEGVVLIAVCSQNRKTVTEHAGKCRKFWIYTVEQGEVSGKTLLELPLEQSLHESPHDQPHPLDRINILIGGGMGAGLQQRLLQRGIQGFVTDETDPDQAVARFLSGEMASLPPERAWVAPCTEEADTDPVCSTSV